MSRFQMLVLAVLGIIAIELGMLTAKLPAPVAQAQTQIQTPAPLQSDTERRFARDESRIAGLETRLRQLNANFARHTHQFATYKGNMFTTTGGLVGGINRGLRQYQDLGIWVCSRGTGSTACTVTQTTGPAQY